MTTELARMAEGLSRSPSTRNIGTTTELSQNVVARVTKTASRQKRQTKTARAKKARVVQRKKEDEGCKKAPCCHTGVADAGRPNPLQ